MDEETRKYDRPSRKKQESLSDVVRKNLTKIREDLGLSQAELGSKMNPPVERGTICRWEGGSRKIDLEILEKLSFAMDVSASEFMNGYDFYDDEELRIGYLEIIKEAEKLSTRRPTLAESFKETYRQRWPEHELPEDLGKE